jgi:transcriptional accessory protein Tex/SPT6
MLNFLQENGIMDMTGLDAKVRSMHEKQIEIRDRIKPAERRLKTLDEHIEQAENYMQYKAVYRQYKELTPKKQAAFAEKHRMEVTLFETAERYFKGIMNGKATLPIKAWKAERDKLVSAEQARDIYEAKQSRRSSIRKPIEKQRRKKAAKRERSLFFRFMDKNTR